jgi:SAM-dependent methyltransferase
VSKLVPLTEQEFAAFVPPKRTLHYIEEFCRQKGLARSDVSILDWGCGRGKETLWLREQGYDAFGVDVDAGPITNGAELFEQKGHSASDLRLLHPDGHCDFPDDFFHSTFSNQVFEHIKDLKTVAAELWRVTAPGGEGHHVFPAHKYLVEGHLFMPLIHWLPKNALRKHAIRFFVATGREPHWSGLESLTDQEKSQVYYGYSVSKTFYRPPSEIRQTFETFGFDVSFETINHPRVNENPVLGNLKRFSTGRRFTNFLLLTFISNELHLLKPGG